MKNFGDLKVWEKAHEPALDCYGVTANFPKHEIFGIVSQIRRAVPRLAQTLLRVAAGRERRIPAILADGNGFCQ
jgi:four helix bundle protein